MGRSLADYCRTENKEYLLTEWDSDANGALTPADISYGSSKNAYWQCALGHKWQAPVSRRSLASSGCPYCTHKKLTEGADLASAAPLIAEQWNREKNGSLTPTNILAGSNRRVWWRCSLGHEWMASVKSRVGGNGCPYCANKIVQRGITDLATTHPTLAAEWHPTKNLPLTAAEITSGSSRKVWWQCAAGHEWYAPVFLRSQGNGCPVCANKQIVEGENDFATANPALAKEWHNEKNAPLLPTEVSAYSNRRVWWKCALGHEWRTTVAARMTENSGCPYCAGKKVLAGFNDLATVQPLIAKEWHPTLNGTLTPEQVTSGSSKRVWWQCADGHVWQAFISARTGQKTGCPECAGRKKIVERNALARIEAEKLLKRISTKAESPPEMIQRGELHAVGAP